MPDYSKGKIYSIQCLETDEVYYGSTTMSLSKRISKHKTDTHCVSRKIIDRNNYQEELIEEYPCNSKTELEARESYFIRNNLCINKKIPDRTKREYRQDNKVYIAQHRKEYNEANKEKLLKEHREYYQENKEKIKAQKLTKIKCECGCEITINHIARHCKTKKHADLLNQA
tara:strand:- start:271 stop:783 length:513 start_codon:yes stop_codon:yes gene_type:complete